MYALLIALAACVLVSAVLILLFFVWSAAATRSPDGFISNQYDLSSINENVSSRITQILNE